MTKTKVVEIPSVELVVAYLLEDEFNSNKAKLIRVLNHMYDMMKTYDLSQRTLIDLIVNHERNQLINIINDL